MLLSLLAIMVIFMSLPACSNKKEIAQAKAEKDLAEAYMLSGKLTEALRTLLKSIELNPKDPVAHNTLGLVYSAKNAHDRAIKHYKIALDLDPDFSEAANNLGVVYIHQKNYSEAIRLFQKIQKDLLYKTPHYPLANLAWCYYCLEKYNQAEGYYIKALKIQPKFINALRGLGMTYNKINQFELSERFFLKALTHGTDNPASHYYYAEALVNMGKLKKAKHHYLKVIKLLPNSGLAESALTELDKLKDKN